FIIRGAQPFEPYVKDLLTAQVYPDMRLYPGGPPKRPYDITGWTLSYQMGVKVDRVEEAVSVATEKIDVAPAPPFSMPAGVAGQPYYFAIDGRSNDAFTAVNRLLKAGTPVFRTATPTTGGGKEWPQGTFLVTAGGIDRRLVADVGIKVDIGPTLASS